MSSFAFVNSEYATIVDPMVALRWSIDKDGILSLRGDFGDDKISYTLRKVCDGGGSVMAKTDLVAESKGKAIVERKGELRKFAKRRLP